MAAAENLDFMNHVYVAYAAGDLEWMLNAFAEAVVFHVAGDHPLSGDHVGRDAVLTYFLEVAAISGGRGGFEVRTVFADDQFGIAIVDGTAYNGDVAFTRPIVHIARLDQGTLVEFWDHPLDQVGEDVFWTAATAD